MSDRCASCGDELRAGAGFWCADCAAVDGMHECARCGYTIGMPGVCFFCAADTDTRDAFAENDGE